MISFLTPQPSPFGNWAAEAVIAEGNARNISLALNNAMLILQSTVRFAHQIRLKIKLCHITGDEYLKKGQIDPDPCVCGDCFCPLWSRARPNFSEKNITKLKVLKTKNIISITDLVVTF